MPYANNKGADQTAQHPRSLISTFVVRCLYSTTPLVVIFVISRLQLASVAEQVGLNPTWSKIPKGTFLRDVALLTSFDETWTRLKYQRLNVSSLL